MRLARFDGDRIGILADDSIRDVTDWSFAHCGTHARDPFIAFILASSTGAAPEGPLRKSAGLRWGPPLRHPGKIVAAAANYRKHTQEMNPGKENPGGIREKGFFLKAPSSIIGPEEAIRLPFAERRTDHEAELAVIVGKGGRDIPEGSALDHVFGYTCLLDITVRGGEDRGFRKSFDTFTPMGPWVTTRDEVPDPNDLEIRCVVNGETRQHDSTRSMIMAVAPLVGWISQVMTLEPGDVIATGTPAGVAALKPGDRVEVAIGRLGTLAVGVAAP